MILNIARLLSLVLTSIATGVALCHALELPNKMALSATMWLNVQKVLYNGFGKILGPIEYGALVTTLLVLFLVRKQRRTFILTLITSVLIAIALIVWLSFVGPANLRVDTALTVPIGWMQIRNQWEYGHATRAGLFLVALIALSLSILSDIPIGNNRNMRYRDNN
ncbi:hypothetical protein Riv7116_1758 [Rivularia sp. PCC 7116]|uniref:hypothetical protein n=1 Tax=Rivularia sp. PCC 7116 TaxID=373994 RepID=UPI00029F071F|nr:hypothetical protein [Rivularia sp. PCC 7116]AFY54303.1 hypothetical protein Riv7116_1758 [Rivularia sp. PCC 7116]